MDNNDIADNGMRRFGTVGKRYMAVAVAAAAIVTGALAWWMWRPSERLLGRCVAVVEQRTEYRLVADGKVVMAFGGRTEHLPAVWINRLMMVPSCRGTLAVPLCEDGDSLTGMSQRRVAEWKDGMREDTGRRLRRLKGQIAEMEYYLKTHGMQDEGYQEMAVHRHRSGLVADSLASVVDRLGAAGDAKEWRIERKVDYEVMWRTDGKLRRERCVVEKTDAGNGYVRLRTVGKRLPEGAKAVSLWPWTGSVPSRLYIFAYEEKGQRACLRPRITKRMGISRDAERGFVGERKTGFGVLFGDGKVLYAGMWKNGKRQGKGSMVLADGRSVTGVFNADTLCEGTRTDSGGVYRGEMDSRGHAAGHGTYAGTNGAYREGKWSNDLMDGFGYYIAPQGGIKSGEWSNGVYRGERVEYNTERIYGIDISRFQHEKGRRKYGIEWPRLRITDLGNISRKRVKGRVDYPVSFVYIKCTEGCSVRNRYYKADYKQAKRHGIYTGSYHFFSTTSPGKRQAEYFLRFAMMQKGDFPPVLDVEPSDRQISKMGGEERLWREVREWLNAVEKRSGVRPVLYISQSFVNKHLSRAPEVKRRYPVWIARYGEYKPDVRLVYWQLSPDGRVNGIKGDVDINVFNGYTSEFKAFLQNNRIAGSTARR